MRAEMMQMISSIGACEGRRRALEVGEELDEFRFSSLDTCMRRRGREGRMEATYSPQWRQARATAKVVNVYAIPSTVWWLQSDTICMQQGDQTHIVETTSLIAVKIGESEITFFHPGRERSDRGSDA
jgi:hypothetical protein